MQYTTNYRFKKPDLTDPVKIEDINDNMDTLDEKVKSVTDASLNSRQKYIVNALTELVIPANNGKAIGIDNGVLAVIDSGSTIPDGDEVNY